MKDCKPEPLCSILFQQFVLAHTPNQAQRMLKDYKEEFALDVPRHLKTLVKQKPAKRFRRRGGNSNHSESDVSDYPDEPDSRPPPSPPQPPRSRYSTAPSSPSPGAIFSMYNGRPRAYDGRRSRCSSDARVTVAISHPRHSEKF
jgi:hypothetical protein